MIQCVRHPAFRSSPSSCHTPPIPERTVPVIWGMIDREEALNPKLCKVTLTPFPSPTPFHPVVLQTCVCPLWVSTRGCGWGLGPVDSVGRLQQVMWWRCVILQSALRQPQVSPRDPLPTARPPTAIHHPWPHLSPLSPAPSRPTIGGKYCLGERRRHRSCNTDVSSPLSCPSHPSFPPPPILYPPSSLAPPLSAPSLPDPSPNTLHSSVPQSQDYYSLSSIKA